MKKLMKLRLDLMQKNNSLLFCFAFLCCTHVGAQVTNTERQEFNKQKIDKLLEKVETITSNQDYIDSILKVNKDLTLKLQELEAIILKEKQRREAELASESVQKEFIVIAVYNKETQAQRFIELNELKGFEVVSSSSKNKFYVAARLQKNENLLISIKAIKNKYNRNAWYVAI
jgi:hypothetical protein